MIDKILERLEAEADKSYNAYTVGFISDDRAEYDAYTHAIEIVQEVAKDGGWIPANVTPKTVGRYLCDVIFLWEGRVESKVVIAKYDNYWRIADGYEILAWQPLPAPYQKGE